MARSDSYQRYTFKPSRIALGFQLLSLSMIFGLWIMLLNLWLSFFLLLLAGCSLKIFRHHTQVQNLEQLDYEHWVVKFTHHQKVNSIRIKNMVDHHLYIVVYFEEKYPTNLVIWQDQLHIKSWKTLKTRAKLYI